jgi:hypothetical protein
VQAARGKLDILQQVSKATWPLWAWNLFCVVLVALRDVRPKEDCQLPRRQALFGQGRASISSSAHQLHEPR